jgi:hypothetical protein
MRWSPAALASGVSCWPGLVALGRGTVAIRDAAALRQRSEGV